MPKQQNSYLRELRRRSKWLVTAPERFPELYPHVRRRMPSLKRRQGHAAVLGVHFRVMDIESQRCGSPLVDGAVVGLSEKQIAIRTGLGDPRKKLKHGNWEGRSTIQRYVRELRYAGLLYWGKAKNIAKKLACNPRFKIEEGPKAGTYQLYPSVRRVSLWVIERVQLNRRHAAEVKDIRERRNAGAVEPIVDVHRRRARDREIKMHQRATAREERLLVHERERTIAASQRTPRRIE